MCFSEYLFAKHRLCNSLDEIYQYTVLIYFYVGEMRKDSVRISTLYFEFVYYEKKFNLELFFPFFYMSAISAYYFDFFRAVSHS